MILLIDHYDSFVYTLARYIRELGYEVVVSRNDVINIKEVAEQLRPSHIILSPGPCTPNESSVSLQLVETLAPSIPILGVCLGHQIIGQAMGGRVVKSVQPMHGKKSTVWHDGRGLFEGMMNPLSVARYHSLVVDHQTCPKELEIHALSDEKEIMAIKHKVYPTYGVQFHPESILTCQGFELLRRFIFSTALVA
ncbi:MAG TPA: aminodeoxychorismate/anthranilate synthase component II [Gammaproteobacteria bacterium]|nr:aminodeoxychorismate/anthranilate synthase component II [Gammaproteobacteria bacterium]